MSAKPADWVHSGRWGIYRDTKCGWIAGVCAGIAGRIGIKPLWIRLAFCAMALVDKAIPAVIIYIVLAIVLERRTVLATGTPAAAGYFADRFQTTPASPFTSGGIASVSARFAALDARLNNIEAAVTSDDLSLRRKFRDLGG